MAYTTTRNSNTFRTTKRFVRSQTYSTQRDGAQKLEDNATNLIGGAIDDPTQFAPHDYHPVDLAEQ